MHGANRTGRPFTGDYAGELLYRTLYEAGLATRPESVSADDGLELKQARIVNSVKCVPPGNKPLPDEIRTCKSYLKAEAPYQLDVMASIEALARTRAVLHKSGPMTLLDLSQKVGP